MSDYMAGEALQKKKLHEEQQMQQETEVFSEQADLYRYQTDEFVYEHRHYGFLERDKSRVADAFPSGAAGITRPAEQSQVPAVAQQQAKELSKAQKDVIKRERKLLDAQNKAASKRRGKEVDKDAEEELLDARLNLIEKQAEADMEGASGAGDKLDIKINKQASVVDAYASYAKSLPLGSKERRKAMEKKEQAEIKLFRLKWKKKITTLTGKEKEHEVTQYDHKKWEARLQAIFSKEDPNCREDAELDVVINGMPLHLVNVGRAFMGGSKPSYYFLDPGTNKRYLYKKAENCCGFERQKGAIMTEIGGKLQNLLDSKHAIPATGVKNADGKYIGSIQEIVDIKKDGFDFNEWQRQTDEERSTDVLTDDVKEQMLTFHAIDWLLCNYDTKGENLLQCADGTYVSIDKEGSMSHILKEGTMHMSNTYKAHTDEPVYNAFFRMYQQNRIEIPEDMLERVIKKVEDIDDEEYMQMYAPYLAQTDEDVRESYRAEIKRRKTDIRKEYQEFFERMRPSQSIMDGWEVV